MNTVAAKHYNIKL